MRYSGRLASLVLSLGLVFSLGINGAMAQDDATSGSKMGGPGGGGRGGRGGGMYGIAMSLTGISDEQKQKLQKGSEESRTKMQEIRKNGGGMPEFQKFQEEQKKDIEAILNDDQKKEFETKVQEMRSRFGAGRRGGETSGTEEKKG